MKITTAVLASLALAFALVLNTSAQEKKKEAKATTLKGEIGCLKCGFSVAEKCSNGIKVKEGDKEETIYAFEDAGAKAPYHKEICTETKKGSVTGVVVNVKKGDKATIKPSKDGVKFE
jgi:hypothetical protein